jgi:WD40 repeat protein
MFASGAIYYSSPTILPASGLLQLTFDSHRNRLYALKATEVDVLDAATLQWQSPLVFPGAAASGVYNAMALTPDGSKLVVSGLAGTAPQFVVLDPDNVSSPSVLTYSGAQNIGPYGSMAVTKFNTVILPGLRGLVLDLSSSTFSVLPLFFGGQVIRASADGTHVYSVALGASNGEVYSIDPSTYAVQSEQFGLMFWSDLAVSPDGSQFAAVYAAPGFDGAEVGFFNSSLQYVNSNVYPGSSPPDDSGVIGATFSPEGTVLVVPLGDSIEFWDAAKGTLRARLMTPEELHVIPSPAATPMIALNFTGQTIYAVSASGLTVLTLPEPVDQIPSAQWPFRRPKSSRSARPALHGSLASRAAMQANR